MINARVKRFIQASTCRWIFKQDGAQFVRRYRWFGSWVGYAPKITWDAEKRLYLVSDLAHSIYLPRKTRLQYYKDGSAVRLHAIAGEYLISAVDLQHNDIVIDIGANIGELSKYLATEEKLRIIAIEPENGEFSALECNLAGQRCELHETALWSHAGELDFYPANDSGDSSLIRQSDNVQPVKVNAVTLDELVLRSAIVDKKEIIKLVKLEAEGAEPEILQGMKNVLPRVEYITADVGSERGIEKESTLIPVQEILMDAGFEPVKFGLPRAVMLFRNTKLTTA